MFKNFWASIQGLWGNYKPMLLAFVIPKLKSYAPELAKALNISQAEADRIIAVICDYLLRQL